MRLCVYVLFFTVITTILFLVCEVFAENEKYRVCIVEGRGRYKRVNKFCPILDNNGSKVECVVGIDRLDCLRRISKGTVHFSVLTSEELVAAVNSQVDVLITNELAYNEQPYEYEVVAVISNFAGIENVFELKNKRLCHPGFGNEAEWTAILANYFESTVVPQKCDDNLTITENRIKSSSEFFKSACKAGPWANDDKQDKYLKSKYPNLCALCDKPRQCIWKDKYWGRRGPLFCLTDGVGDVAWARVDDLNSHFGIGTTSRPIDNPDNYQLLCRDGTTMPVTSRKPCVWVAKPWPVIAAERTSAHEIQDFIASLTHDDVVSWESALLHAIETYHVNPTTVSPIINIEKYLSQANGFLSANSFSGCHPPRTIRVCTISNIENAKCGWMREAAQVYGIEPDVGCLKGNDKAQCMMAVKDNFADVIMLHSDMYMNAVQNYNLTTLFYEVAKTEDLYLTVAVVKKHSNIYKMQDLRGRRACFPSYQGVAWHSVIHTLKELEILPDECPFENAIANFFGDSCVPGIGGNGEYESLKKCQQQDKGDKSAFQCLLNSNADVAFMDLNSFKNYTDGVGQEQWSEHLKSSAFRFICIGNSQECALSWAQPAQAMIRSDMPIRRKNEIYDVFMQIDNLFGKYAQGIMPTFNVYGPFDGQRDILFLDKTDKLNSKANVYKNHKIANEFHSIVQSMVCTSSAIRMECNIFILIGFMFYIVRLNL